MSNEMIDRLALAIWDRLNRDIPGDYLPLERLPDPQRGMLLATARVAIGALRNPTPEMVSAMTSAYWSKETDRKIALVQIWQAGIDAALGDGK